MISSEVQRTLVKSAPELWAEVSDPAALARHLGELGDIRITRIDPEQRVEWEACDGDTSGTVVIKPSGWGTKVMLTVTREMAEDEGSGAVEDDLHDEPSAVGELGSDPAAEAAPIAASADEPGHTAAESAPDAEAEAESEPFAQDALDHHVPEPAATLVPEPQPRRGFFARLFGRRRVQEPTEHEPLGDGAQEDESIVHTPTIEDAAEPYAEGDATQMAAEPSDAHVAWAAWAAPSEPGEATAIEPRPSAPHAPKPHPDIEHAFQIVEPPVEETHDAELAETLLQTQAAESHAHADHSGPPATEGTSISAEIRAAEEVAAEEVTAVLTGVLDRLGAAHHRPFSRA